MEKTKKTFIDSMEQLLWKDVRKQVNSVNPTFAKIVDELNPDSSYKLFKITLPYGSEILKNGKFHVPNRHNVLTPLASNEINLEIQKELSYNVGTNPVSMLLSGSAEIFIHLEQHTIPLYGLIPPGKIISTWRVLNPQNTYAPAFIWNMTAGARSIFLLSKIANKGGYERLRKELHISIDKPNSAFDHWEIFREIATCPSLNNNWRTEILFFGKKWFENLHDPAWLQFKNYLLEQAWLGSEFWRNQFTWDMVYDLIQFNRQMKPNPYLSDTAQYLLAMGCGAVPGFAPANDDFAAPIELIKKVLLEVYKLEEYIPIFMQPAFFSPKINYPVYYSLQYPNTIKFSPRSFKDASKAHELYQLKLIMDKFSHEILTAKMNLHDTPFYKMLQNSCYDYFHDNYQNYNQIKSIPEIIKDDAVFSKLSEDYPERKFPAMGTFLRGSVRIMLKKQ